MSRLALAGVVVWLNVAVPVRADDTMPQKLLLIQQDGKYGYIDRTGKIVVKPQYDYAIPFRGGMARVQIGDQWTYVNDAGEEFKSRFEKPFRFQDSFYDFAEGLAATRVGGKEKRTPDGYNTVMVDAKYGYIDKSGNVVIKVQFDGAGSFSEGLAAVNSGGKWGYIDKTGAIVVQPKFDGALAFSGGLGRIEVNRKWGLIDRQGKVVVEPQFDEIDAFAEDRARVHTAYKFGFIDRNGELVIKQEFDFAAPFSNERALVRKKIDKDDKFGFIDRAGKLVVPVKYGEARSFSDGLAAVKIGALFTSFDKPGGKWGYIDTNGNYVIEPTFRVAGTFSEGLASAAAGEVILRYGYIDKTGKFVIEPQFNHNAGKFKNGIASVSTEGLRQGKFERAYIDKMGRYIWKVQGGKD